MSYNKVMLLGNLGQSPEVRFTPAGKAVCAFSVATSRKWRDNAGTTNEETEWHNVVAFDKLAEACGECLKKGSKVFVEGRIKTEKWTDLKEGKSRITTKIYAERVEFLDKREKTQTGQAATPEEEMERLKAEEPPF